jgi:hypothetical protein
MIMLSAGSDVGKIRASYILRGRIEQVRSVFSFYRVIYNIY